MADTAAVDVAFDGRPGAVEVASILAACCLVFVALVRFDRLSARDEADRARAVLADRAAAARGSAASQRTRARTDGSIGDAGPISVPVLSAWGSGTSASVGHDRVAAPADRGGPPALLLAIPAGVGALMTLAGSALLARARR